jgi:hypothetical protein
MIPRILILIFCMVDLLYTAAKHETPYGNYNFWIRLLDTGLLIGLLLWGGFFHFHVM